MEWMEGRQNRDVLQSSLSGAEEDDRFYWWLNCCYDKISRCLRSDEYLWKKIMPNQKREIKCPQELRLDYIQQEELKEVADCFQKMDADCNIYGVLLDKKVSLSGWNMPVFNDNDVTMRINRALQKLLSEMNLSQADMVYQEACLKLLGWIQEYPDLAKDAFPNYYKEEDQMKLLTWGAAVDLQRKAKKLDRLREKLGTDDPDEILRMLEEIKGQNDEESMIGIWDSDELAGLSDHEKECVLRAIGLVGKTYAYGTVKEFFQEKGYGIRSEEERKILLSAPEGQEDDRDVEILWADTEYYHQSRWDILVSFHASPNRVEEAYYLEVKTHTTTSEMRETLSISNDQMKMAAQLMGHFVVLSVECSYPSMMVTGMESYIDLIRCMADGRIWHAGGKYLL